MFIRKAMTCLMGGLLVLSGLTAVAAPPGGHLNVTQVFVDDRANPTSIMIFGEDLLFGAQGPTVTLGGFGELAIVGTPTDMMIEAMLPATIQAGDYLLTVSGGSGQSQNDEYDLTIGGTGNNVFFDQPPVNNMQPYGVVNYIIALQGVFPSRNQSDPFIAEIVMFAGNFAPRGWAFCDGQLLAISSNTALFSLLGTNYGGDGRTSFGLPDLRGRVPLHAGDGPGLTPRRLGQKGGSETTDQPPHNHDHL